MKILFLSRWFPYPVDNGAKLRISHLLKGLVEKHEVHLISFRDPAEANKLPGAQGEAMLKLFRSVQTTPLKIFQPTSRQALLGLFKPDPRSLQGIYSLEMEAAIRKALQKERFDLVIASEWQMTAYRQCFAGQAALFEEMEIGVPHGLYANAASLPARLRQGLTWAKFSRYMAQVLAGGQPCTVVSEEEKRLLEKVVPDNQNISVIPNGVDLDAYAAARDAAVRDAPEPNTLIFTGSFHYRPNHQAMVWFLREVYPLIRARVPGVHLTITGDSAGLPLPSTEGVTQTGFVDDIRPLLARSWVSVAPLHVGGGTRLKILEAMAIGTPVVSTAKGAEGLAVEDRRHLFIANDPETFANRVVEVLQSSQIRAQIARNACQLVQETYDWKLVLPKFMAVVEQAAEQNKNGRAVRTGK